MNTHIAVKAQDTIKYECVLQTVITSLEIHVKKVGLHVSSLTSKIILIEIIICHQFYVRHCSNYFSYLSSFSSKNNSMKNVLPLSSVHSWGKQVTPIQVPLLRVMEWEFKFSSLALDFIFLTAYSYCLWSALYKHNWNYISSLVIWGDL